MGYEIKVEGEDNRGLAVWLVAMKGLACDIETHEGAIVAGQIDHVADTLDSSKTAVYLLEVDESGMAIDRGKTWRLKTNDVAKVSVW